MSQKQFQRVKVIENAAGGRLSYRERRLHYLKTGPTSVAIGERRCPDPQGQPV